MKKYAREIMSWSLGLGLSLSLFMLMLLLRNPVLPQDEELLVRKVAFALPPPPPPPPPIQQRQSRTESETPTINLLGAGAGPSMEFSQTPKMSMANLLEIEKPDFDISSLDMASTISVSFPIVKVENLDAIPRALSHNISSFPRELSKRGIRRVDTRVEIIIDQHGRAYVKKIVDPVYPEMIEVIREWVANVRFTIPTKNGQPVQAMYLYSIIFNNRS